MFNTNPGYPAFPILSFFGFLLPLLPLRWHLHSWNSGTCFYAIWASLACLNQFINSVIWARDAIPRVPAFCEISIRITLAASVAFPLCSLCIQRRLYYILKNRSTKVSRSEKRRAVIIDSIICVGLPLVFVALQYVVQGHRYDIYESLGCRAFLYNTIPVIFLTNTPPLAIGLISALYCALSMRTFRTRQTQIHDFLRGNNTGLTHSNYTRFKIVILAEVLFTIPLSVLAMVVNARFVPIAPYINWDNVHFNYSRIDLIPALIWRAAPLQNVFGLEFSRWATVFCALFFFAIFGLNKDARANYKQDFMAVCNWIGLNPRMGSLIKESTGVSHPIQFNVSKTATSTFVSFQYSTDIGSKKSSEV